MTERAPTGSSAASAPRIVHRACPTCEASCGLDVEIDPKARRVLRIEGDREDQRSQGYLCPKAYAMKEIYEDPERLKRPLRKRPDGSWEELDWDTALDYAAGRLKAIKEKHGANANGFYIGNPTGHNVGGQLYLPPLLNALGTQRSFSAGTMDQFPQNVALHTMLGEPWMFPIPDLERTEFFVCMGGNPLVSQGSLMSGPNIKKRLRAIVDRGGRVVTIDPRRTETAEIATDHVFIKPGSDAYFLLSVCQILFAEGLVRPGRLADFTDGIDRVRDLAARYSPERVADATGIAPETTRRLVRDFCAAKGAWYGRIGLCTQEFGTLASWLVYVVNVLTGRLDAEGGMLFPRPATGRSEPGRPVEPFVYGRYKTVARGIPEVSGQIPCGLMAEEMEEASAGEQRMRGFITVMGNPVLSAPNGERLAAAMDELEFMVSLDIYLNETTRHADLILPSTVQMEHENYDFLFETTSVRNFARWSPAVFQPEADQRDHWRILIELGARIAGAPWEVVDDLMIKGLLAMVVGPGTRCPNVTPEEAFEKLEDRHGPMRMIGALIRVGPYGDHFDEKSDGLNLRRLREAEHGLDLGPLDANRLPAALPIPRIQLAPDYVVADLDRLERALGERSRKNGLVLVGRRQIRNMNSWLHNLPALAKGPNRCTLILNPEDAKARGLESGKLVRVRSRVGEIEVECVVSDEMMPGVVSLPHGYGHTLSGTRLSVAKKKQPGACANYLTDELALDVPSGTHVANGIPVEVRAL
ncbi:MAG: molybdopterin-dependent oxidoreductase [Deltaproteobacteria bacterium]|nr:molybdopterin-dependent oxidoreductase [Deltaproteobacteria bacterium]